MSPRALFKPWFSRMIHLVINPPPSLHRGYTSVLNHEGCNITWTLNFHDLHKSNLTFSCKLGVLYESQETSGLHCNKEPKSK